MSISVVGPTMISLVHLLNTDIESLSNTFIGIAVGRLTGSLLAGFVYDRLNQELFFLVTTALVGVFLGVAPFTGTLPLFVASMAAMGTADGMIGASECPWGSKGHSLKYWT